MKHCMKNTPVPGEDSIRRILFVISSLAYGGAERVVSELANEFCAKGLEVGILLISAETVAYPLDTRVELFSLNEFVNGFQGLRAARKRCQGILAVTRRFAPDMVISFMSVVNIYSCLALKNSGYPLIVSERNDPSTDPPEQYKRNVRDFIYRYAHGVVCQTRQARDYFGQRFRRRLEVIPNPVKTGLPLPYEGKREQRIVAVGRLEPQKNYPLLLAAFAHLSAEFPGITLDIYGDGSLRNRLEDMVLERGIKDRVTFHGAVSDVHERIRDAYAYILTSNYEGMPNALMEAMALGLPCVASDCPSGGPAELIQNGKNGLLFPVGDLNALIDSVRRLLVDGDMARRLGNEALKIREEYECVGIAQKWITFAETVRKQG